MPGGFNNPVVGGDGELVRVKMRSVNYVPGVSGWAVFRDGDAEFNNAIFRGEIVVGGATPPNFELTETIPAELVTFYQTNWLGTIASFVMKMNVNANTYLYEILLSTSSVGPARAVGQVIAGDVRETYLAYSAGSGSVIVFGTFTETAVQMFSRNLLGDPDTVNSDMLWGNTSLPRGTLIGGFQRIVSFSFTSTTSLTEQLATTFGSFVFTSGRAFEFELNVMIKSAAAQSPGINLHKTNLAGTLLSGGRYPVPLTGVDIPLLKRGVFINTSGVDVTALLALGVQPQVATAVTVDTGAGGLSGYFHVKDIGAASEYTSSPSV